MELSAGIEPASDDYKSTVFPLNYKSGLKYGLLLLDFVPKIHEFGLSVYCIYATLASHFTIKHRLAYSPSYSLLTGLSPMYAVSFSVWREQ